MTLEMQLLPDIWCQKAFGSCKGGSDWEKRGDWEKLGKTMDQIINNYMSMKQEEMIKGEIRNDEGDFSLLKGYTIGNEIFEQVDHKVIKDSTFGLIFAIEDTTSSSPSRFFWLLTKNPKVETKIRQELETIRPTTEAKSTSFFSDVEVLHKNIMTRL
ncbi:CYTOCHROME P450 [Salix koriyanagi]|uniref:CYTOCHROME P450 n=1 Tax=Salix koriyanagi TaxID=2511006 RepID=A0A9Q0SMF1_9ROSI|nr:CYTOCHROME P450 [Salix koriyanagi]